MNYGHEAIIEVHEIAKTVEIVLASDRTFRLEVVKVEKGTAEVHFDVSYYERQTLYRATGGTITSQPQDADATEFYVWVPDLDLPNVHQSSEDDALTQALDRLADRRNNQNIEW